MRALKGILLGGCKTANNTTSSTNRRSQLAKNNDCYLKPYSSIITNSQHRYMTLMTQMTQ